MTHSANGRAKWLVCALLAAAVMAVYWPALHCGFVNYDDPDYVVDNWHVQHGLNWAGLRWAFTTDTAANWHPLTLLSHSLDCRIYGLAPAGHHLTSLLLHAANAVLLFLLLHRLTGALGRSAIVAALFAIHPLRVESVVWVSERKDVLSALFWMLTVGAYVRYADDFKFQISNFKLSYALALVFFALGLMAKPMLVTLPFVLFLLDYWPLRRWEFGAKFSWQPVVEKVPFLILAAASSLVTYSVQHRVGAVASLARFPLGLRLTNVPVAYMRYLLKNFWPTNLASYYPYITWSTCVVVASVAFLAAMTVLVVWRARSEPYLTVGWFWFLGVLVPTIGFVQAGGQSLADRYTYLPCIGLWIALVWGLHGLASARPRLREAFTTVGVLAGVILVTLTWRHTGVYKNSGALWEATLRSNPNNLTAHNLLSRWFIENGQWDQALAQSRQALALLPDDPTVHDDLSRIFLGQGKADEAIAEGMKSIQDQANSYVNRQTLARAYLKKGDFAAAADALRQAIRLNPASPEAWCNLGLALLQQGRIPEATAAYERSLDLKPDYALAHNDLGNIFLRGKRTEEATDQFQRAVEFDPAFAEAHYNLAGMLAYQGRLDEAIAHCRKALEIQPNLAAARQRLEALNAAKERKNGR